MLDKSQACGPSQEASSRVAPGVSQCGVPEDFAVLVVEPTTRRRRRSKQETGKAPGFLSVET